MAKKRKKAAKKSRKRSHAKTHHKVHHKVKKPKKPKKPKGGKGASLTAWENYDQRMTAWHQKVRELTSDAARKHSIMNKHKC